MSEIETAHSRPNIVAASAQDDELLATTIRDMHDISAMRTKTYREVNTFRDGEAELHREFFERVQAANSAADVFAIFVDEQYAPIIKSFDLCSTPEPNSETIKGLKSQYSALLDQLVAHNIVEGELPRRESSVQFNFNLTREPGLLIGRRNRTLFSFEDYPETLPQGRVVTVAKRMEFLIDARNLIPNTEDNQPVIEQALTPEMVRARDIQRMIDDNHPAIVPTDTRYYVTSRPNKEDTRETKL